jgi:AcrR family transcriptional regulator
VASRDALLDAAERLIATGDAAPTLEGVAAAAGVSKGGLLYHFPTKAALLEAVVERIVARADEILAEAAERGGVGEAWLRLSVPDAGERRLFRGLLPLLRLSASGGAMLAPGFEAAYRRWRGLLRTELGEPDATVVGLVGDGLFLNALTGVPVDAAQVDSLVDHLTRPADAGPRT